MAEEFKSGLEGVVAFQTEIAEPDKEGGALRYRGVDIDDLVGQVPFEQVWGLLVDGSYEPGMPPATPYPLPARTGDTRVDVQAALAQLAPAWGFKALLDIDDDEARDNLARSSVMALSFVAQSARGTGRPPVPEADIDRATSIPERFLIRWRGEADPKHVKAIDAYWISAAEHGMNASTFTARVIASTGADVAAALSGAVGALSRPAARRRPVARPEDARRGRRVGRRGEVREGRARPQGAPDGLRPPRLPGRGPARPRAAQHRARGRRAARRGGRGARGGRAGRAQGALPRPRAGHQRRVLVRRRARLRAACPRTCSRRCSRVRAWRAGRRTSSSRSARRASSGPTADYVGPAPRPADAVGREPAAAAS